MSLYEQHNHHNFVRYVIVISKFDGKFEVL